MVDGCSYPVANSGFGNRCFCAEEEKTIKKKRKKRPHLTSPRGRDKPLLISPEGRDLKKLIIF
jgi:hypothetical protein